MRTLFVNCHYQLKKQTADTMMWHKKVGELQEINDEKSDKICSMERYMADLPTSESRQEHAKQVHGIQDNHYVFITTHTILTIIDKCL